jgi:hypothetical protein
MCIRLLFAFILGFLLAIQLVHPGYIICSVDHHYAALQRILLGKAQLGIAALRAAWNTGNLAQIFGY